MSKAKKKRNHWVPQSYLRAFAADGVGRGKIWTFAKDEGDPLLKPIEKVAVRFYLYARPGQGGLDYSFEDKLASLEQQFGMPHWKAACNGMIDLRDPFIRKGLALLAAVMFLRNPQRLAQMRSLHRRLADWYASFPELPDIVAIGGVECELDKSGWAAYRDADDEAVKHMWLDYVGSAVSLAKVFLEMRWAMMISETPLFITSDDPVVPVHEDLVFRGFLNPGTMVVFPLSPTRVLHMDWRHEEPDGAYYALNGTAGATNHLIWRNAIRHMFSARHPDEVCAEMVAFSDQGAA